jgi:hypothetical protein
MLHHRLLYAPIHKLHHKYKETTPFSSYAFHPLDGWLQGCPYHIFVFLFPMVELATLFSPRYYYAAKTPLTHDTPYGPRNHTHPGVAATLAGRMATKHRVMTPGVVHVTNGVTPGSVYCRPYAAHHVSYFCALAGVGLWTINIHDRVVGLALWSM